MKTQQPKIQVPEGFSVRYTIPEDVHCIKEWLGEEGMRNSFPMIGESEIEDAALRWVSFCRFKCSLTLVHEGVPCGLATLYLQPYQRIAHQCEFGIILKSQYQGKGLGSYLLSCLIHLAKEKFKIKLLHLTVCADNPAVHLYEKFGFRVFGRQEKWMKDHEKLVARLFMEKELD